MHNFGRISINMPEKKRDKIWYKLKGKNRKCVWVH